MEDPNVFKLFGDITAHRDHSGLTTSVVSALRKVSNANEVRAFDICCAQEEPKIIVRGTDLIKNMEEPLRNYPAIQQCMLHHLSVLEKHQSLWFMIQSRGVVSGCLYIKNYDPAKRNIIDAVCEVYRNHSSVLDFGQRDCLTGLFNRHTFHDKYLKRVKGDPKSWLAMMDIDHFKRVNDVFGHSNGDQVLKEVAKILQNTFRFNDLIFRHGGEEFVILLNDMPLGDARKVFERFRRNVEEHDFADVGKITVSLGCAGIHGRQQEAVLKEADLALYHAKLNGRNRVCFSEDLISPPAC